MTKFKICIGLLTYCLVMAQQAYSFGMITHNISQAITKNLNDNLIKPQLKIKNLSGRSLDFTTDRNRRFLAHILEDGSISAWDLAIGIQRPRIRGSAAKFTHIAVDPVNETVAAGLTDGNIAIYDILTASFTYLLSAGNRSPIVDLSVSDNGLLLASYKNELLIAWNLATRQQQWKTSLSDRVSKTSTNSTYWAGVIDEQTIEIRNLTDGSPVKRLSPLSEDIVFLNLAESQNNLLVGYESGEIVFLNVVSGAVVDKKTLLDELTLMDAAGQHLFAAYSSDSEQLIIKDSSNGSVVTLPIGNREIDYISFNQQQNQLFVIDKQGRIDLFDITNGDKLLRLISTIQGWTVIDGVGRFDTSESGLPNVSWEADGHEIPLDKFSNHYYEPGLLTHVVAGKRDFINKNPAVVEQGITLPPKVQPIIQKTTANSGMPATFSVEVSDQGGGIDDVNVFHNGKALAMDQAITSKQPIDGGKKQRLDLTIYPVAGENVLKAVASNKQGIESESAEITFSTQSEQSTSTQPTLQVVAIGINQYADPRLNLDYSVADAQSVAELLRNNKLAKFNRVEARQLYDQNATRAKILKSIEDAGKYSQNDILTIYMAGHGIVIDDEWYFLPHEAILQPSPSYYSNVGISAKEIKDLLIGAKAQKILLMVDSCYSGAGLDNYNKLINNQRHMSRSISRSVGIIVLAAARENQEAAELTDLGHGLFTYVVTIGMQGKADLQPRNTKVSAYEIVDFSKETIPSMSKKYVGASQDPVAFRMGTDFELLSTSK